MKLTDMQGTAVYQVTDSESGRTWGIYPRDHLTARQAVYVVRFPDIALQFGHVIAKSLQARGYEQIEVQATVMASLNGRDPQLLIDPTVDLAEQLRTLAPASWILPLEEPSPA